MCKGDRMLQDEHWNINHSIVQVSRCDGCCEGNQVNPLKEKLLINRYLAKYGRQFGWEQSSLEWKAE
jgi:hypothetical protein